MTSLREREIIGLISSMRANNNVLWMQLVEIALEKAPKATKKVLSAINANDANISDLLKDLAQ